MALAKQSLAHIAEWKRLCSNPARRESQRSNTTGCCNTASGAVALFKNTEGGSNEAFGFHALFNNTTGSWNNAFGGDALVNNVGGESLQG
jgi:hypothetical protein